MHYKIFTDGGCKGNPGPGGYASVIYQNNYSSLTKVVTVVGTKSKTTNNEMELGAIYMALRYLLKNGISSSIIEIFTDSQYSLKTITEWSNKWIANGTIDEYANANLIKCIKKLIENLEGSILKNSIKFYKIKGHSGVAGNEEVDYLLNVAIKSPNQLIDQPNVIFTNHDLHK